MRVQILKAFSASVGNAVVTFGFPNPLFYRFVHKVPYHYQ